MSGDETRDPEVPSGTASDADPEVHATELANTEFAYVDACALLDAYRQRRSTPSAVFTALEARIARLQPTLNAFSAFDPGARDAARASDARWAAGEPLGPLDGVPLIVKDNLAVRGLPASWGNAALAERPVDADELPVARLRAAGALFVGKGNTPEFAVEGYTANARFGVSGNPFDPALTPGGSSGGVVGAVAAGLVAAGIGTDGGGSIRRPAGYTGLVGLKPGIGRVPRDGGLPQLLLDFEVVGPLTRSVRDARLLFDVLSGADRRDPASRIGIRSPDAAPRSVLVVERLGDAPVAPAITAALARAAGVLERLGLELRTGALPLELDVLNAGWTHFAEIALANLFERDPDVARAAAPTYREMAARGRALPATRLGSLLDAVSALRASLGRLFGDVDAILLPSSAAMPWPAAESHPPIIDGVTVGPRGHAIFTGWVNAAGHPALALPAPVDVGALPIGVQIVGDLGADEALLALGERYERETGGFVPPSFA